MTGQKDQRGDRYDRARSPDEPGAHSGAESRPQERSVPGTASAKEGYQPEQGTTAGKPLEGVETEERSRKDPDAEDGGEATGRQGCDRMVHRAGGTRSRSAAGTGGWSCGCRGPSGQVSWQGA
ncbi:hypothetical protein ABZ614_06055 [Streptomyces sp. NPDC013178]|uniref:hypothetical protein n=1 Tax=Streptomyces sp. NPDC013178 TaxID=3155118 RepID=UPI0033E609A6